MTLKRTESLSFDTPVVCYPPALDTSAENREINEVRPVNLGPVGVN